MTNDKRITKSGNRNTSANESFLYNDAESMVREEPTKPRVYDWEEHTARFGEAVIDFVKQIPQDAVTNRLISQLVGAAGFKEGISEEHWNLSERSARNEAFSSDDRSGDSGIETTSSRPLLEAKELHLMFSKIWRNR
jgi:hypothetical protein